MQQLRSQTSEDQYNPPVQAVIQAYLTDECGPEMVTAFQFLQETNSRYLTLLTNSILDQLGSVLNDIFENASLAEYLQRSMMILEAETSKLNKLLSINHVTVVESAICKLIFSSKLDHIPMSAFVDLIQKQDKRAISICVTLAKKSDSIFRFSRTIMTVLESEVSECYTKPHSMSKLSSMYTSALELSAEFSDMMSAFERGLNSTPDVAAELLALELHREIMSGRHENIDKLISIFRMVDSKDVFQSFHASLLGRRVLTMRPEVVELDRHVVDLLERQCGEDYVCRFVEVLQSVTINTDVFAQYQAVNPSSLFSAIVLPQTTFPGANVFDLTAPQPITNLLDGYATFYQTTTKKKLTMKWEYTLSRVVLAMVDHPFVNEVQCSAACATVLLLFNERPLLDLKQIKQATNLGANAEKIMDQLTSKRARYLVSEKSGKFAINPNSNPDDGVVKIEESLPKKSPVDEEARQKQIRADRNSQIDAAIMRLMKRERTIQQAKLEEQIKDMMSFRMDKKLFLSRLNSLAERTYLSIDSTIITYIP